jgi:hypothetical protein
MLSRGEGSHLTMISLKPLRVIWRRSRVVGLETTGLQLSHVRLSLNDSQQETEFKFDICSTAYQRSCLENFRTRSPKGNGYGFNVLALNELSITKSTCTKRFNNTMLFQNRKSVSELFLSGPSDLHITILFVHIVDHCCKYSMFLVPVSFQRTTFETFLSQLHNWSSPLEIEWVTSTHGPTSPDELRQWCY